MARGQSLEILSVPEGRFYSRKAIANRLGCVPSAIIPWEHKLSIAPELMIGKKGFYSMVQVANLENAIRENRKKRGHKEIIK